jgi:hypothetical protein
MKKEIIVSNYIEEFCKIINEAELQKGKIV